MKNKKKNIITIVLAMMVGAIFGTQVFGEDVQTDDFDVYINLMANDPAVLKNLSAGVNGQLINPMEEASSGTNKVFKIPNYKKDNQYFIQYNVTTATKLPFKKAKASGLKEDVYQYEFTVNRQGLGQEAVVVEKNKSNFPFDIRRSGQVVEKTCKDGRHCIMITYIIENQTPKN